MSENKVENVIILGGGPAGYEAVLPHFYELPIDQFVLDFANREMIDVDALKSLSLAFESET
mgnify:CR=1 FL=1